MEVLPVPRAQPVLLVVTVVLVVPPLSVHGSLCTAVGVAVAVLSRQRLVQGVVVVVLPVQAPQATPPSAPGVGLGLPTRPLRC